MINKKTHGFDINLPIEINHNRCVNMIHNNIYKILYSSQIRHNKVLEAMEYMLLGGGKMLRPFFFLAINSIFTEKISKFALNIATSIEMIHTYSIIHDDLPVMDNDDYRRGKPTCHKKFGEGTAVLAGNGLLTLAFELLSKQEKDINNQSRIIYEISKLIGHEGLILGQSMDLNITDKSYDSKELIKSKILKTANLFIACSKASAIINDLSKKEEDKLSLFAEQFGIAYQVKDDIEDGEDKKKHSSAQLISSALKQGLSHLEYFYPKAILITNLAQYCFKLYLPIPI